MLLNCRRDRDAQARRAGLRRRETRSACGIAIGAVTSSVGAVVLAAPAAPAIPKKGNGWG